MRAATRIKAALTADPTLAQDEMRIARILAEELKRGQDVARIPSCLRDDR